MAIAQQTMQEIYDAFCETWRPSQEKVDEAIRLAIEIAAPSRIFLFGSWPKGNAKVGSDLDLAVFLPDGSASVAAEIEDRLLEALDSLPLSVDLVLATEAVVLEFAGSVNSIFSLILREGQLVYEQQGGSQGRHAAA